MTEMLDFGPDDDGLPRTELHRHRARSAILFGTVVAASAMGLGLLFSIRKEPPNTARFAAVGDFPEAHAWFNTSSPLSLYRELSGHVVILLFCDFTRLWDAGELDRLQELRDAYETAAVEFVAVYVVSGDGPDAWRRTVRAWGIDFPVIVDHDSMVRGNFGVSTTPQLVVLDAHARVLTRYGEEWTQTDLAGLIDDLINEGVASRSLAVAPFRPDPGECVPPELRAEP